MFGKQLFLSLALVLTAASTAAQADVGFDLGLAGFPAPGGLPIPGVPGGLPLPGIGGGLPLPGIGGGISIGLPGFNGTGDAGRMRNGLPPTRMDSFVYEAREKAEQIYGDEGVDDIPPFDGFTQDHRINAGIVDVRNEGLTTGHGSLLPNAWGGDEYTGAEMSQSGPNNGFGGGGIVINIPGFPGGLPGLPGLPGPGGLPGIGGGFPLPTPGAGLPTPGAGLPRLPGAFDGKMKAIVAGGNSGF